MSSDVFISDSDSPVGVSGDCVVKGLRGIIISFGLVLVELWTSDTWESSSAFLGENKLQILHMNIDVPPRGNSKHFHLCYFI